MKISIWGVTQNRGLPLALLLRQYGRHSVVGHGWQDRPLYAHPDPEVRRIQATSTPLPIAPTAEIALREGSDLAIVATREVQRTLTLLNDLWQHRSPRALPVIVVYPVKRPYDLATYPIRLAVGYAPFTYHPERVTDRLLNLRRITVTAHRGTPAGVLRRAVTEAWTPIDNKIPIREQQLPWGAIHV